MLDIQRLRSDLSATAAKLNDRGYSLDTARFEDLEARRKSLQTRTQEFQARRNALSRQIGIAKSQGADTAALMAEVAAAGDELQRLEGQLTELQTSLRDWMLSMPNMAHESVPIGRSEADNVEVRRWGDPTSFSFEPRDHVDLGT